MCLCLSVCLQLVRSHVCLLCSGGCVPGCGVITTLRSMMAPRRRGTDRWANHDNVRSFFRFLFAFSFFRFCCAVCCPFFIFNACCFAAIPDPEEGLLMVVASDDGQDLEYAPYQPPTQNTAWKHPTHSSQITWEADGLFFCFCASVLLLCCFLFFCATVCFCS